jgi:hypothetical protein
MAEKKRKGMLTSLERERLDNYEKLNAIEKKNLNFRLKKKQNEILETISDINMLLKNIQDSQIEVHISHEHLYKVDTLIENILKILKVTPIVDSERADATPKKVRKFRIGDSADLGKATKVTVSREATEEEINIHKSLVQIERTIKKNTDPNSADSPPYSIEYFNQWILPPLQLEAANKGKILQVSADGELPNSNCVSSSQEV